MLKALGITALAFIALLLWTSRAHAASLSGELTLGWGEPAITIGQHTYVLEGVTYIDQEMSRQNVSIVDQVLAHHGRSVQVDGTVVGTHIKSVKNIIVNPIFHPDGQTLYSNPDAQPVGGNEKTWDTIIGTLSANTYEQPILSHVTPEIFYGSYTTLRLPLVSLGSRYIFPYMGQQVQVEGQVYPNEYGQWECITNRIWVDGVEI